MKKNNSRSSETLLQLAHNKKLSGDLTYQRILETLGERAFGIVILFFALPSALPLSAVPGVSFLFSVPIAIFATQMIILRNTLWLPKILAQRTIHRDTMVKFIHKSVPYLVKAEYFLKPRWAFATSRFMESILGVIILFLSLLLMLPIPFSNFFLSLLLIIFSLGLIEKDGLMIMIGYVGTVLYVGLISMLILAFVRRIFI